MSTTTRAPLPLATSKACPLNEGGTGAGKVWLSRFEDRGDAAQASSLFRLLELVQHEPAERDGPAEFCGEQAKWNIQKSIEAGSILDGHLNLNPNKFTELAQRNSSGVQARHLRVLLRVLHGCFSLCIHSADVVGESALGRAPVRTKSSSNLASQPRQPNEERRMVPFDVQRFARRAVARRGREEVMAIDERLDGAAVVPDHKRARGHECEGGMAARVNATVFELRRSELAAQRTQHFANGDLGARGEFFNRHSVGVGRRHFARGRTVFLCAPQVLQVAESSEQDVRI
ncbi:MAG: hypothetical protein ABUL62_31840 [Myxococcales bacterium]